MANAAKKVDLIFSGYEIWKVLLSVEDNELIDAIEKKNFEEVHSLIQQGSDVNGTSNMGETPLCHAVNNSNLEIVNLLLSNNANVESDTEVLGLAVAKQSVEIIKVLLQNGANPNILSKGNSKTDFMNTISFPDYIQKKGRTALHLAADEGYAEAVNLLLEYGANVDCRTRKRLTPLMIAADRGHFDVVRILLESNATIHLFDSYEKTAFHAAAKNGHINILQTLLNVCFNDFQLLLTAGIYQERLFRIFLTNRDQSDVQRERLQKFVNESQGIFLKMLAVDRTILDDREFLRQKTPRLLQCIKRNTNFITLGCKREIAKQKNELLGNSGVSFFDILTKNENLLATFVKNEDIVEAFKSDDLESKFPIYVDILRSQFHKGETRKKLLQKGMEVGHFLFTDFVLPDLVMEKILKYLNNKAMKVFITACTLCCDE